MVHSIILNLIYNIEFNHQAFEQNSLRHTGLSGTLALGNDYNCIYFDFYYDFFFLCCLSPLFVKIIYPPSQLHCFSCRKTNLVATTES